MPIFNTYPQTSTLDADSLITAWYNGAVYVIRWDALQALIQTASGTSPPVVLTTSTTLTTAQTQNTMVFSNVSGAATHTLPTPAEGLSVHIYNESGNSLTINPPAGAALRRENGTTLATGTGVNNSGSVGARLLLVGISGVWIMFNEIGTWSAV